MSEDPTKFHEEMVEKQLEDPVFAAEYWKTRFELENARAEEQHRQNKANLDLAQRAINGQKRLRNEIRSLKSTMEQAIRIANGLYYCENHENCSAESLLDEIDRNLAEILDELRENHPNWLDTDPEEVSNE